MSEQLMWMWGYFASVVVATVFIGALRKSSEYWALGLIWPLLLVAGAFVGLATLGEYIGERIGNSLRKSKS